MSETRTEGEPNETPLMDSERSNVPEEQATRGQTTLDFAIGIVIFLAVVLFVFTFVPGILEPFDVGGEENPTVSDRIANSLAQDKFGDPAEPYALDRYCTVAFFEEDGDPLDDCRWDEGTLDEEFNLSGLQNVNVTITGNIDRSNNQRSLLCWTESSDEGTPGDEPGLDEAVDCDTGDGDIMLASGDEPPAGGATTITARRIVSLHGESVMLQVIVW